MAFKMICICKKIKFIFFFKFRHAKYFLVVKVRFNEFHHKCDQSTELCVEPFCLYFPVGLLLAGFPLSYVSSLLDWQTSFLLLVTLVIVIVSYLLLKLKAELSSFKSASGKRCNVFTVVFHWQYIQCIIFCFGSLVQECWNEMICGFSNVGGHLFFLDLMKSTIWYMIWFFCKQ